MMMKLIDVFRFAIELGRKADARKPERIEAELRRHRERYEKLGRGEKERFDPDFLWNPYSDSRLLYGDPEKEVKELFCGIDITSAEMLLVDRLREKGQAVDAVIGHHPLGKAKGLFSEVVHVQEGLLEGFGIPINVAEDILAPRIKEVFRGVHPQNFNQAVDAARLLDIPLMCLHCPCDNLAQRFVQDRIDKEKPERISDILTLLSEIPEFDIAMRNNSNPDVYIGEKGRRAGKIMVKMAGGVALPKEAYEYLSKAGVGTVVCMHLPESHLEEARKAHINIVVSGHVASDSLGLNLVMDRLEKKGVTVHPFSGFIRVKRK
jgi:putative NIF3 family GTP cyclohydrolase 1 type 2